MVDFWHEETTVQFEEEGSITQTSGGQKANLDENSVIKNARYGPRGYFYERGKMRPSASLMLRIEKSIAIAGI